MGMVDQPNLIQVYIHALEPLLGVLVLERACLHGANACFQPVLKLEVHGHSKPKMFPGVAA